MLYRILCEYCIQIIDPHQSGVWVGPEREVCPLLPLPVLLVDPHVLLLFALCPLHHVVRGHLAPGHLLQLLRPQAVQEPTA